MRGLILSGHWLRQVANQLEKLVVLAEGKSQRSCSNLAVSVYKENLVHDDPEPAEDRLSLLNLGESRIRVISLVSATIFRCLLSLLILW